MSSDMIASGSGETLNRMKTTESVFLPISRETFEKLYLSPKPPSVEGSLRKKLGNPTPICLMGFLLAATPNSCVLMGWRGAGGNGGAILYAAFGPGVKLILINLVADQCISSLAALCSSLAALGSGLLGIHSPARCSLHTVCPQFLKHLFTLVADTRRNILARPGSNPDALLCDWDKLLSDRQFPRGATDCLLCCYNR